MQSSPNLDLPYIMPSQAQKHVTHNEALRILDALVQLHVRERQRADPPDEAGLSDGAAYIVATGATGAWTGRDRQVAVWQDGAWAFYAPRAGWLAWVADETILVIHDGDDWIAAGLALNDSLPRLAINADPDENNRLLVRGEASLFTHGGDAGGTGDHRVVLNKQTEAATASLLFQTAFSGRAEFGLAGSNDWQVKVSPDGATWKQALVADAADGTVAFPCGLSHAQSHERLNGLVFTPGGDGQVSIYRNDVSRSQIPRTATLAAVSGDTATLADASAALFFDDAKMRNVSYLRIWNQSRSPESPAWIRAAPAADTLQFTNPADVAGWAPGDVIRIGDPDSIAPTRAFALDISPMLANVLGSVFPQSGLLLKTGVAGNGGQAGVAVSAAAVSGSQLPTWSFDSGTLNTGTVVVPSSLLSPISNSNLVFVREDDTAPDTIGVTLLSVIGVFA